jgi:hypothetical protein
MTCSIHNLGDGTKMIVCGRHSYVPKGQRCRWCNKPGTQLCDHPIAHPNPLEEDGHSTCDARICKDHAQHVGEDKDYCPDHTVLEPLKEPKP